MLIRTRSRGLKEGKDDSTNGETTDYSHTVSGNNDQRDSTVVESTSTRNPESEHEKEISPEPEPKQLSENEDKTVDPETNLIFVGENVLNRTLPESTYLKLLNSKFAAKDC